MFEIYNSVPMFVVDFCFSPKNLTNFQHRNEKQDESSHYDRRCSFLEMDFDKYSSFSDREQRVSLEYGRCVSHRHRMFISI